MADAKEAASSAAAAAHTAEATPGGSNKAMMGLLALNMVIMVVVAIVLLMGQKRQAQQETLGQVAAGSAKGDQAAATVGPDGKPAEASKNDPAPASEAKFFSVGDFITNLQGPASEHHVKITVNFEMSKDADDEELKQRKPQFRDKVLSLLNSKQPDDLQTADGRSSLKEEIKTVSNTFLKKGKVEGVYFSQFVVN